MRTISFLQSSSTSYPSFLQRARWIEWRRMPKAWFMLAVDVLRVWRLRARDRAQLALLDERMLRDIGISRSDILTEINKPFWRK